MVSRPKIDQIRIHGPTRLPDRRFSVVVSFRRARWQSFTRRWLYGSSESEALASANDFAAALPTMTNWRQAPPKRITRQPVTRHRIDNGSIFRNQRVGFLGSVFIGLDQHGKRIRREFASKTREGAQSKLDSFMATYNGSLEISERGTPRPVLPQSARGSDCG